MAKPRDYRREYDTYQGTLDQKRRRAKRNAVRRKFEAAGRVKKGDGMDIDHVDGNPHNNSPSNLKVVTKAKNRSKQ